MNQGDSMYWLSAHSQNPKKTNQLYFRNLQFKKKNAGMVRTYVSIKLRSKLHTNKKNLFVIKRLYFSNDVKLLTLIDAYTYNRLSINRCISKFSHPLSVHWYFNLFLTLIVYPVSRFFVDHYVVTSHSLLRFPNWKRSTVCHVMHLMVFRVGSTALQSEILARSLQQQRNGSFRRLVSN